MAKVKGLRAKKKQDEAISDEIERLNDILKNLHPSKKAIAKKLIENIAFMSITLADLQELIKTQGPIIRFEQGAQKLIVENPAQKSYNTMVNRFNTAIKQLFDLLPKDLVDTLNTSSQNSDEKPRDKLTIFMEKYK